MNLKAVIFDKDGVLIHTEPIYFKAYKESIKFFNGTAEYDWDFHKAHMGISMSDKFESMRKTYGFRENLDTFTADYRKRFTEAIDKEGIEVLPGVFDLLRLLKTEGIKYAVATGSIKVNCDFTLHKAHLDHKFDVVVNADDVAKSKPDPECFLLAAKKLGVEAHECVVIGDSINDVLGGKSAGMKVVAVIDPNYSADPDLASPDLKVRSLQEITIDKLRSL